MSQRVRCHIFLDPRQFDLLFQIFPDLFRYLMQEELVTKDPMQLIELPKKESHLPEVLSMSEVEMLLQTPDVKKPLGLDHDRPESA